MGAERTGSHLRTSQPGTGKYPKASECHDRYNRADKECLLFTFNEN